MICDPDFLNQKLINHLTSKENIRNSLNRRFSHAPTYEDFVKMIKSSSNVDELKQFHYKIMHEVMQATIINDFKNSKLSEGSSTINSNSFNSGIVNSGSSSFYVSFSNHGSIDLNENTATTQITANKAQTSSSDANKNTKADMLRPRNLKKYIKQLRYAKLICERRLNRLNGSLSNEDENDLETRLKNRKVFFCLIFKNKCVEFFKFYFFSRYYHLKQF